MLGIFIDAGYLQKITKAHGNLKIDFKKLISKLKMGTPLLRCYVYDAVYPLGSPNSNTEKMANKQKFLDSLAKISNVQIRLGKVVDFDGPVQKGVDSLLIVDLVSLASKHLISRAILLAGDSDFVPAVELAKNEGVNVRLLSDHLASKELVRTCDSNDLLDEYYLRSVQI